MLERSNEERVVTKSQRNIHAAVNTLQAGSDERLRFQGCRCAVNICNPHLKVRGLDVHKQGVGLVHQTPGNLLVRRTWDGGHVISARIANR